MAKTFEVKTMKALRVTEKTAGTESTAKIKSVVSTSSSTSASGVRANRPSEPREKLLAVEIWRDGKKFPHQPQHEVFFRPHHFLLGKKHFRAGKNEERAEDVKHPVELVDERRADGNHRAAHHQRAENAPEQQPVLEFQRHAEPGEDERDDEDVVERKRKLDDIAGGEGLGVRASAPENHREGKRHGQRDPQRAPRGGFPEFDGARAAVKRAEVQREKNQHAEQ